MHHSNNSNNSSSSNKLLIIIAITTVIILIRNHSHRLRSLQQRAIIIQLKINSRQIIMLGDTKVTIRKVKVQTIITILHRVKEYHSILLPHRQALLKVAQILRTTTTINKIIRTLSILIRIHLPCLNHLEAKMLMLIINPNR